MLSNMVNIGGQNVQKTVHMVYGHLWMALYYALYIDDMAIHKKVKHFCMSKTRICLSNAMLLDE